MGDDMSWCESCDCTEAEISLQMDEGSLNLRNDCDNALMAVEVDVDLVEVVENFSLMDSRG